MTIAITPFDGLCGFRPLAEITHFLKNVPALRELVGEEKASEFEKSVSGQETSDDSSAMEKNKKALQTAFTSLMESKPEDIEKLAPKLIQQAKDEGADILVGDLKREGGVVQPHLLTNVPVGSRMWERESFGPGRSQLLQSHCHQNR